MSSLYHKKMPPHLDANIKRSLRFRFFAQCIDYYILSRTTFAIGTAVFAGLFLTTQLQITSIENQSNLYQAVLSEIATEKTQDQQSIVHLKMRVSEGRDKAHVVAALKDIDPEITQQVPSRSEVVETWHHGTNVMTVVQSELPQTPTHAFMNRTYENKVEVLTYSPLTCEIEVESFRSPGCLKEKELSDEQQAHRTLFDGVHNIESDYEELLSVHTKPFNTLNLEPMIFDRIENEHIILKAQTQENLKREYRFKKNSLTLESIHTFLLLEDNWFEMSILELIQKQNLKPDKLEDIFNPENYPLTKTEEIQLI